MMETVGMMGAGLLNALTPINLFAIIASTTLGIIIGCLPGLSAAMGVALLLPVTFGMDPGTGLIVLGGIYCGAIFGGSISAILIHTPGTPASAATAIEGYQMTLKGKAAKALAVACYASFCGGLMSCISLYFFSPMLAELAMQFKSPEYFWLSIFGLTVIAGVSSKSILKGLMSGILGLLISTIGMDPMEGVERFMFGQDTLYGGVNVTCALIGLFSMSQVPILAEKKIVKRAKAAKITDKLVSENNLTTLMITHNMHDAIAHGNRLIMMHEGKVAVDVSGEAKKQLTIQQLLDLFEQASGSKFGNDAALLSTKR